MLPSQEPPKNGYLASHKAYSQSLDFHDDNGKRLKIREMGTSPGRCIGTTPQMACRMLALLFLVSLILNLSGGEHSRSYLAYEQNVNHVQPRKVKSRDILDDYVCHTK